MNKNVYLYIITYYLFDLNVTPRILEREPRKETLRGKMMLCAQKLGQKRSYYSGWLYAYTQEACQRMAIRMSHMVAHAWLYAYAQETYQHMAIRIVN